MTPSADREETPHTGRERLERLRKLKAEREEREQTERIMHNVRQGIERDKRRMTAIVVSLFVLVVAANLWWGFNCIAYGRCPDPGCVRWGMHAESGC